MGIAIHSLYSPDGTLLNLFDRGILGTVTATYGAGTTTGLATAVAVTWGEPIVTPYAAVASPIEASTIHFTSKTAIGMTVNVTPLLTTATLAGGSLEVLLVS